MKDFGKLIAEINEYIEENDIEVLEPFDNLYDDHNSDLCVFDIDEEDIINSNLAPHKNSFNKIVRGMNNPNDKIPFMQLYVGAALTITNSNLPESSDCLTLRESVNINLNNAILHLSFVNSQQFRNSMVQYIDRTAINDYIFTLNFYLLFIWFDPISIIKMEMFARVRLNERNMLINHDSYTINSMLNATKDILEGVGEWNGKVNSIIEHYKYKGFTSEHYRLLITRYSSDLEAVLKLFNIYLSNNKISNAKVLLNLFFSGVTLDLIYYEYMK